MGKSKISSKRKSRIKKLLRFLKEIDKAKYIERIIHIAGRREMETDAEHSWYVAMFVMLFEKDLPKLNIERVLKIVLIHDLVEIYAGDTFSFDKVAKKSQKLREVKAAKKLFRRLPKDLEKEFWQLFKEYEELKTKEALVAKSFDRVQPMMQHILNKGETIRKFGIKKSDIEDYVKGNVSHDETIMAIYNILFTELIRKKLAR